MATQTGPVTEAGEKSEHQLPGMHDAVRLLTNLRASMAHHELVEGKQLSPLIAYLSAWQSMRLSRTHADMLADPRFSLGCRFFLDDIYAPKDFSQRDYDGHRIYNFMNRFLPEATLAPLAMALEVNSLTQQLDLALAEAMRTHLGVEDRFDRAQYEEAYRLCDNYDVRRRQIRLIVTVGQQLERVRRVPFIQATLRLARRPAQQLGWYEMQDFLERGYHAWKSIREPEIFLANIGEREMAILDRIYGMPGGAPEANPFLVSDGGQPEIVLI
ncbi:MAG TPA: hypothetical protein PKM78_01100 [Anaerolineae bacterium]|nr:hypothetical protein [Anaerolineae bacterium]HNU03246.1 hypothetical protein [Anaerolineae bacterium]